MKFINELQKIIDRMDKGLILTPTGNFYRPNTINNWRSKLRLFSYYEKILKQKIKIEDIDYHWCYNFQLWRLKGNYSKNTISNTMGILKAFIRLLYKEKKIGYNGEGIRTQSEITTAVFTSVDDIRKLLSLDLSDKKGLERVRDVYVCQCFLGLRMSDTMILITNLGLFKKEIAGKLFFEIKTKKTGEVVVIPASKIVLKIAEKRGYDFGKPFTQQYYIREIKRLFRLSGLDRDVVFNRTEGGVMTGCVKKYSELVGTHTPRRTFATNAYLSGLNPLDIMKITGHRSFNSFSRYIRCENTAVAMRIASHEFFNMDF